MNEAKEKILTLIKMYEEEEDEDKEAVEEFILKLNTKEEQDIIEVKAFVDTLIETEEFN